MKRLAVTLGGVLLFAAGTANAATVNFEDKSAFSCNGSGSDSSGGLSYSFGFYVCYYSPSSSADFPTTPPSTVMASGYGDTTFTLTGGGGFDLSTLDLAFGPFGHGGLTSDTTLVTGNLVGGGTISTTLTVGYGFQTYALDWSNLSSVTFGQLQSGSEYLAFDNINYDGTPGVPEPASWALLVGGFGAVGGVLRSRRRAGVSFG